MPVGTCDPATRGEPYNVLQIAKANGDVQLTIRYGWDGVSTRATGCDGPLVNGTGPASNRWAVKAENLAGVTYYAHTTRKNGQPVTYTLEAGQVADVSAQQAAANGYTLASDFGGLDLTTDPTHPGG
jgi:hypothetical protein